MAKKLTISDVAQLAGVSKATASRVLNGNPQVDAKLRERVLQIVKEYDFVPSINALGLNGRKQLLGILVPRYLWVALQEIIWSISSYVSYNTRYELIFYSCSNEEGYSKVIDQIVQTNLVAGLIATLNNQTPDHLLELYRQGLPVVLVDTIGIRSELPTVCANHYQGAYEGVRYLLELGHRRIAYIQGLEQWQCSLDRYQAYQDAMRSFGIEPDPQLFQLGNYEPISGTIATRALLDLSEPPTAIFAANDDMASGAMSAAQERRLRIPEDLSILGFNDDPVPVLRSMMTTIHQPFNEMARCAAELLISMIQPEHTFSTEWQQLVAKAVQPVTASKLEDLAVPVSIEMPTNLIVRNSCTSPSINI